MTCFTCLRVCETHRVNFLYLCGHPLQHFLLLLEQLTAFGGADDCTQGLHHRRRGDLTTPTKHPPPQLCPTHSQYGSRTERGCSLG